MRLVQSWPLLWVSGALIVGAGLAVLLPSSAVTWLLLVASLLGLVGLGLILLGHPRWLLGIGLGLVVVLAGLGTLVRTAIAPIPTGARPMTDQVVTIVSAPGERVHGLVAYADMELGQTVNRVRLEWIGGEAYRYGTRLVVDGRLRPGAIEERFNERGYLLAHGAMGVLEATRLEVVDGRAGHGLLRWLHDLRLNLIDRLRGALAAPEQAIVAGILLGERSDFSAELEEVFRRTGTTHILVVSGSNVVVIAMVVLGLVQLVHRRLALGVTALVLAGFVVVSGADTSVVRATMFYGLYLLAQLTGRRVHGPTVVAATAALMLLITPWLLIYDAGFQLSFAAVLGLVLFQPWFNAVLPPLFVPEYAAPALAAHVATLPILVYTFGSASLVAPLVNALIGPLVPVIMALGAAVAALPGIRLLAWLAEGVTTLLILVVTSFAQLPWAAEDLPRHHLGWTTLTLALLGVVAVLAQRWLVRERRLGRAGL
ncbi:ComEC/Rec2 family competence protein [Candidatus Berkelbacteria bacterium]|nr:ComEC/Rec2 family competence protein [Candidatus Berkelbacteria bacterium]